MAKSDDPFRWLDSSPEVIRLVVLMYVRYPLSLRNVEHLPRDGAAVVEPLRTDVRRGDPQEARPGHAPAHPLEVASGRGLRPDQWRDALHLAGDRPRGRSPGILRHQGARQGRSPDVHQEGSEAARSTEGDRHRWPTLVQGSLERDRRRRATGGRPLDEQSRREQPPALPTT